MQVLFLGRAPRTKETLPDFLKWRRVTRCLLVFRGLTGSQRTPGFWGVTICDFRRIKIRFTVPEPRCLEKRVDSDCLRILRNFTC